MQVTVTNNRNVGINSQLFLAGNEIGSVDCSKMLHSRFCRRSHHLLSILARIFGHKERRCN